MPPTKMALFVGNDISSHLLINRLIPKLLTDGIKPILYYPVTKVSPKARLPEIQKLAFYERDILGKTIFPFLDLNQIEGKNLSPNQMKKTYGVEFREVQDVNSSKVLDELCRENVIGGISIRCYQKFSTKFISTFKKEDRFLWNLHPGRLPYYQGVSIFIREMFNDEKVTALTLHAIDEEFDTGPIIEQKILLFDYGLSVLSNYCTLYPQGAELLAKNISNAIQQGTGIGTPQNKQNQKYYSYPTPRDLEMYRKKGLQLIDKNELMQVYIENFSNSGFIHQFKNVIFASIEEFEGVNK